MFIDLGQHLCMEWWLGPEAWSHVICEGTHPIIDFNQPDDGTEPETEPCLCECHTRPVDIIAFIQAYAGIQLVESGDWHGGECPMREDKVVEDTLRLAIAVPATADLPCECGSFDRVEMLTSKLVEIAERYGPDHEVTRLIAMGWSDAPRFDPAWLVAG